MAAIVLKMPNTPAPMAGALKQEYPEVVETATRLLKLFIDDKTIIQYTPANGERKSLLEAERLSWPMQSFFKIFTYNFTEGNAANALGKPTHYRYITDNWLKGLFSNQPALIRLSMLTAIQTANKTIP
jgi:putative ABC transport system permease protein